MLSTHSERVKELFNYLANGDERACNDWRHRLLHDERRPVLGMCEMITEAFHQIGQAWKCDEISIYREQIATQIGYRLLQGLRGEVTARSMDAPVAIGCTPAKDPYTLPTLMVELVLGELGWRAHSLGNNLPLDELLPALDHYRPQLCWVSISYAESNGQLTKRFQLLRKACEASRTKLVYGGRCVSEAMESEIGFPALRSLRELELLVLNKDELAH